MRIGSHEIHRKENSYQSYERRLSPVLSLRSCRNFEKSTSPVLSLRSCQNFEKSTSPALSLRNYRNFENSTSQVIKREPVEENTESHGFGSLPQKHSPFPVRKYEAKSLDFETDVEALLRAIQSKSKQTYLLDHGQLENKLPQMKSPKKRYECTAPGCLKQFYQKTPLEIHTRAHTGVKPYVSR
jgi:hypothetical protein